MSAPRLGAISHLLFGSDIRSVGSGLGPILSHVPALEFHHPHGRPENKVSVEGS